MTGLLTIAAGVGLGLAFIALLVAPRHLSGTAQAGPVRAAHARAEAARRLNVIAFDAPPAGTRWLVCKTTTCARLTTRHTPAAGAYQCADCGHITKEVTA